MNPQNLFITLFTCVDILNKKILSESPFFIYECKGEKKNSSSRLRPSKERKVVKEIYQEFISKKESMKKKEEGI